MKRVLLALVCLISGTLHADEDGMAIDYDLFHDTLAPYGVWFNAAAYGPVWQPSGVDDEWAPYTDGYWAYTDAGWTWVSYEEWGAITYHYGRWVRFQEYGWCWVPGYEWGPAWVSWRMSDDWIGWAPLPPEARWRRATGLGPWVDAEFDIGPALFRFCRVRDFGAPVIRQALMPPARNAAFIEQTWNVTNITHREDRDCTFNGGLDPAWLAPLVLQPVPVLRLVRNRLNVFAPGSRGNVFIQTPKEGALVIASPPRQRAPETPRKSPPAAKVNAVPIIDRGWGGPQNGPERTRILAAFRQQLQGANSQISPAKPFHPGLVTIVPNHAQEIVEPPAPPRPAAVAAPVIVPEPVNRGRSRSTRGIVTTPPPDVPPPVLAPPPPPPNHAREDMAARQREADMRDMEQQRAVDAQRHMNELNARRQADAVQQRHMELLRQQQSAAAARSQPVPPPPHRAPIAPPPPSQPPPSQPPPSQPPPRSNPPPQPPGHPPLPGPPGSPPPPGDPRRRGP